MSSVGKNLKTVTFSITVPEICLRIKRFSLCLGSIFSFIPDFGKTEYERFYFDWLFIHIAIFT